MRLLLLISLAVVLLFLCTGWSYSQAVFNSNTSSGNWSSAGSWSLVSGSDANGVPDADDTVIIRSGHTISLTSATSISKITINSSCTLSGSTNLLTVGDDYIVNGTHSGTGGVTLSGVGDTVGGTGNVSNTGTFTISGSKTIPATASLTISGLISISGTITVTNNGTINSTNASGITGSATGSTWVNAANSTLNIAGPILATGTLTATAVPNTINYNSTTAAQTIKGTTYHALTITKVSRTATLGGNSTVNGKLTIASGILSVTNRSLTVNDTMIVSGRFTDSSSTTGVSTFVGLVIINPGGSWGNPAGESNRFQNGIINNGTFDAGTSGSTQFNTNDQTLQGNTFTFFNLAVTGAITVTNKTSVTVTNNLTGSVAGSTWLNDTGSTLTAGRAVLNTGTLIASAPNNTVLYTRSGNQTMRAVTYEYLTLSGSGSKTASGSITVNKDFIVNGSAVFASGNSFTHTFNGNWSINSTAGTWFTYSTANTIVFATPSTPAATSISGTSTATIGFNSVNINNTSGFSTPRNFTVTGTMTVASGVIFTPSATVTIGGAGTLTGAGTVQVTRTAATADFSSQYSISNMTLTNLTVEYVTSGQVLSALTYGKLKISGSIIGNTNSATIGSSLNVTGTFISTAGTITMSNVSSITNSGTLAFFNVTAAASASVSSSSSFTVGGTVTVGSSGSFVMSSPVTISGTSIVNNGTLTFGDLNITGSVTTSSSFTVGGSLDISGSFTGSGGIVTMSGSSKTISGAATKSFYGLTITGSVTTAQNFSLNSSLSVSGTFTATAGTATITSAVSLSGTANLFNVTLNNGTTLQPGSNATLGIAGALTLNTGTLDVVTNTPNTIQYNGSSGQTIVATTYHHIVLSGNNTKTASAGITVNGDITISSGTTFNPGSATHTILGNWNNSGTFSAGTSTIAMTGSADIAITGSTTFNILTLNKTTSSDIVTLNNSISVATLNMTSGRMETGSNSVTITSTRTGNGIILGTIIRTHAFANSTSYEFEGQQNTVTFSSGGTNVSSITITVVSAPVGSFPLNGSINRLYTISVTAGGAYNGTLRLHYEDAELNGNSESGISLWRYSGSWMLSGKTGNDVTNNWVEQSSLTDITGSWTLSDDQNIVQWSGAVSAAWATSGNWTIIQGAPGTPPSSGDVVQLGTSAVTNQPTITSSVSVRSITFGSTSAITLTLGSGGSLTTSGNISGNWSGNATHSIVAQNQTVNVGGDVTLSDGTSGHDINLSVGRGSVSITGSLTQSGNASIAWSDTGAINIGHDFIRTAGTFSPGTGTVNYNGSGSQIVAGGITYNNLSFTKTAGTATLSSSATVNGNLTLSTAGVFQISNTLSVAGNVTIGTGTTLQSGAIAISVGGNWTRNGTYTAGAGTVTLNGSGSQTVSATSFNNLTINKSSGTATLSGNLTIAGDVSLSSGILDLGTSTANRSSSGGTLTLAAGTTLRVGGANNFPANYLVHSISATSTVEYNSTGVQTVTPTTYGDLTFSNGASNAKSISMATTVNGNLLINSGSTLNAGSNTITLYGNWTNSGTFTPSTSSVIVAGTAKNISGTTTFYSLSVQGSYTASNNVTVTNLMDIAGSFNAGATTTTVSGDFSNDGSYLSSGVTTFSGTSAQTLTLESGFVSTGTVNFNGTVAPVLSSTSSPVFNNLNINNTAGVAPNTGWTINGTFIVGAGGMFTGGTSTHTFASTFTNSGIVTSSGRLKFIPSGNVTLTLKGTTFTSTGVIEFGGTGLITVSTVAITFSDIIVGNTHASGITIPAIWTIGGNLTIGTGATLHCGAGLSHTLTGDLINDGTVDGATSTITMNGADASIEGSGTTTFNNLTITNLVTATADFNIAGNLVNNGTFDGTGNTVSFTGSGASTISGSTNPTAIDRLTIAKSSGSTTTLSINLNNVSVLTVASGIFSIGTRTITQEAGGGEFTINDGATMRIGGASNFPVFDTYDFTTASTVEYNGTVTQTVSELPTYGNLLFSNSGTKNISGAVTADGNATISVGATVAVANAIPFTVNGNINNSGTFTNHGIINVGP